MHSHLLTTQTQLIKEITRRYYYQFGYLLLIFIINITITRYILHVLAAVTQCGIH